MKQTKMTISKFVKKRYEFVKWLILCLKNYKSNIPDDIIRELIDWMKGELGYLYSDNDVEFHFRYIMTRFYYDVKTTTFTNFNEFILTAEKCNIIECVCQILQTLILKKGNNDKVEIYKCIFKDIFYDEFCKLRDQLTIESKDLQQIINHPNIDKYTLSMIHSGILGSHRIYVDYTNLHENLKDDYQKEEELTKMTSKVDHKISEIELAEKNPKQNKKYIKALKPKSYHPVKHLSKSFKKFQS